MILDTNALSAVADGDPLAAEVLARAERVAVPVIVLGEYRMGIADSRHRADYEKWLQDLAAIADVLDVDAHTAQAYAEIGQELKRTGRPIPTNDLWIAALCRQHAAELMSRDLHFDSVTGLHRLSW